MLRNDINQKSTTVKTIIKINPIIKPGYGLSCKLSSKKPKNKEINCAGKNAKLIKMAKYFGLEYFVNIE